MIFAGLLCSQAPPAAPAKPDSDVVKALIEKAKKTGGSRWAEEAHFFCEAPRANSPSDPPIEPTRIFDDVYVIGNQGTVAVVIKTSAGLLMIDALSPDQTETQLLRGFQKLGLDPSMVKIIVVGHGHADHFGDSAYFRSRLETYGTAHARGGRGGPAVPLLKHDQLLVEGPRGKSA
jgi:metallo-beta-lactamase class B